MHNQNIEQATKSTRLVSQNNPEKKIKLERMRLDLRLKLVVTYFLLGIFAINTLSALAVIFCVGFGKMSLSDTIILSLIAETIAYGASTFFAVTRYLYPNK